MGEEQGERMRLPRKVAQVVESRKVWAGVIGVVSTLALWWLGEIDGAQALEAMTWVLGIFMGSVALEDGMAQLFRSLAHGVMSREAAGVKHSGRGEGKTE